jgi:ubiquinone/menaquinone biosynthesis C-methylase UbiE
VSTAFDALAADYDRKFTATPIGRRMRQAVWRRCDARFPAGARVLEMNCGTGEDAVHLGRRGVRVLATDIAAGMVACAAGKIVREGVAERVTVTQLAWQDLDRLEQHSFDGALSNFGGLNCLARIDAIRAPLARRLRPGATALFCVMGPWVPWEWLWFLLQGEPRKAFRRLGRHGAVWSGARIQYPSIRALRRALSPDFSVLRVAAIGALLPPPYTASWAERHPLLLAALDRCERRLEAVPPLPWLADHYLLEAERS